MQCQRCCHPLFETISSNNNGVQSLLAGNFQESIRCFHRALECSRKLLVLEQQEIEGVNGNLSLPSDLPQECERCREHSQSAHSCHKFLSRHTPSAEDNAGVQVFNEPITIDLSWSNTPNQEASRNLVVATVILNTAMTYHLVSFSQDNAETVLPLGNSAAPLECRRRARGLYEKALQVLMTLDAHLNEIVGIQSAVYDLVLMAILNNMLSMKDMCTSDPNTVLYTQHLMMYAMDCGHKCYGERSQVTISVSKWQGEFLANAMVSKFCEFSSASAA